ncbi:hypothetical protein DENSPDRAFT_872325 [Dentipellis sp. KUC8613]|nr:hypothetical protein DENSPDRAFT_872325 [Dentipellis sp. KUC8613]
MVSPSTPGLPVNPFEGVAWDNTLGALLIGGLLSGILYGITCTQCWVYYEKSSNDRLMLKFFVACLWLLDSFDFALNGHLVYHYLVTNYTNPLALTAKPVWSLLIHVLITSITDFMVRTMFARRIWRLSHQNKLLTAGILATSLLDLLIGIIIVAKAFQLDSIDQLSKLKTLFYINFASGTGSDVYVAGVLCYFLHTSRTGFNTRTDSIISVLMLYTINTGLLTAIDAFMGMILYVVMPTNFIFITFYLQLSKLYSNAYLATLNNRGALREKTSTDGIVSIHLSQLGTENGTSRGIGTWIHGRTRSEADTRNDYPKRSAEPLEVVIHRSSEVSIEEGRGKDTAEGPMDDKWAARSPA